MLPAMRPRPQLRLRERDFEAVHISHEAIEELLKAVRHEEYVSHRGPSLTRSTPPDALVGCTLPDVSLPKPFASSRLS